MDVKFIRNIVPMPKIQLFAYRLTFWPSKLSVHESGESRRLPGVGKVIRKIFTGVGEKNSKILLRSRFSLSTKNRNRSIGLKFRRRRLEIRHIFSPPAPNSGDASGSPSATVGADGKSQPGSAFIFDFGLWSSPSVPDPN
jgi:hypothetical protein